MSKWRTLVMVALSGMALVFAAGCSSSPSEDELKQLSDLQAQVRKLEDQVATKQGENANLEKQIAEKNGKLQQCQADQDAVKKATGGK